MPYNVLLISAGIFHPPWLGRFRLRRALRDSADFDLHRVSSLEKIPFQSLDQYEAMVLYFHQQRLSTPALETMDSYVRLGGGLLGIHSVTASFMNKARYFEILGGQFKDHGPVQPFLVEQVNAVDEVFKTIEPFTVRDELYRHEYDPEVRVHFSARVDAEREPIVWTRPHGRGRVCYCALGHRSDTMHQPEVQKILQRGLKWACEGKAIEKDTL